MLQWGYHVEQDINAVFILIFVSQQHIRRVIQEGQLDMYGGCIVQVMYQIEVTWPYKADHQGLICSSQGMLFSDGGSLIINYIMKSLYLQTEPELKKTVWLVLKQYLVVYEQTSSLTKILISDLNFQSAENSRVLGRPKSVDIVFLGLIEVTCNITYFLYNLINPTKGVSTITKAGNKKYMLEIPIGGKESHHIFPACQFLLHLDAAVGWLMAILVEQIKDMKYFRH